ncbi:MAG: peptide-methionine (S)-S-oxide reductase MsrA [Candidatus Hydrogenedentes bacterium]|nr:peptide-methionine (S)-S-oxide reductase MsrA [Candidatus Hydrogenedentota bacterium]
MEKATLGAGCFWGVEAAFRQVRGVEEVEVGYAGGHVADPSYKLVCSGATGHAEVVQITFDPAETSFEALLEVLWQIHDPTTKDRQGPDVGSQYRSIVLYHSEAQRETAERSKAALGASGQYRNPIVTEIVPFTVFHRGEEYHQRYLEKHGKLYCR